MKTLLVLRHAKSSWNNANLTDFERPLNKRGKRDAPRMGEWLKKRDLTPDLIITSSAERALQTAEAVALAAGYEGELQVTRQLYLAEPATYLLMLSELEDRYGRVLVVGHNPGVEDLVELFTDEWERMPTAALAQIELPIDSWADLDVDLMGELKNLWYPKELGEL
ncbi:MAG: histidine phosphatase family protein [Anaerolineae bacterium]